MRDGSSSNQSIGLLLFVAALAGMIAGVGGAAWMAPAPPQPATGAGPRTADRNAEGDAARLADALERLETALRDARRVPPAGNATNGDADSHAARIVARLDALLERFDQLVGPGHSREDPGPAAPAPAPAARPTADPTIVRRVGASDLPGGEGMVIPLPDQPQSIGTTFDDIALEQAWRLIQSPDTTLDDVDQVLCTLCARISQGGDSRAWLLLRLAARHGNPDVAAMAIDQLAYSQAAPPLEDVDEMLRSPEPAVLKATYQLLRNLTRPGLSRRLFDHTPPDTVREDYGQTVHTLLDTAESNEWGDDLIAQLRLLAASYPKPEWLQEQPDGE